MHRLRPYTWLLGILAVLALIPALAACGGDDDDGGGDETTTSTIAATTTGTATAASATTAAPSPTPAKIGGSMILATTTSTQDSGLLDVLVPMFKEQTGIDVKVIAVGTGAALEMGAKGDADAVLVHAPASEKKYVDAGDLVGGKLVMHNDYVLVGPTSDPAKAKDAKDLKSALTAIAATGPFISRGDDSGTHKKELETWQAAGIALTDVKSREESGQGMGATLNIADQKSGYTLTDRGTYLSLKKNLKLEVVFQGEKSLLNIYSVYVVSPEKHTAVKKAQAEAFVAFMVAPDTQKLIGEFKKAEYGESLFIPDAGKTIEQLGN
ncbi:MAG: substrate-binding domain-containing protein [Dehalococcoidia bacterium]|nr:substrate-binding domain-containing protein [Dehalococcoidia bacterium]